MRIVHLEPLPDWIRALYDEGLPTGIALEWADRGAELAGADAILTAKQFVSAQIIDAVGSSCRLIQVQGRAPWAVDWNAAAAAGIPVSSIPHRGAIAVAEHAMSLMLAVFRKIVAGHHGTVTARYRDLSVEPIRTDERTIAFNWLKFPDVRQLYGKNLGLIGLGDIGLEVARRARAFDMSVTYYKRHPLPEAAGHLAGVRYLPLDELLATSDVVSLHAPHTPVTENFIDAAALKTMRQDAVLINTARGGLVDEAALATALRNGDIGAAGLDVFLDEPLPADHPFLELDNVVLSPHVGGGTGGGQRAMARDVIDNLERLVRDEPLLYLTSTT